MLMREPFVIFNFKNYEEAMGKRGLKLIKICEKYAKKFEGTVLISPNIVDLSLFSQKTDLPLIAQHVDPILEGKFTGHISIKAVKNYSYGVFLNHSERKLSLEEIEKTVELCRNSDLKTFCFASSLKESEKILSLNPDFLIYEPPELIGTGVSVSKTEPEIIFKFSLMIKRKNSKVTPLCGAGISSQEDLIKALELGTSGVALSSSFVKSENPERFLNEFLF